LSLLLISFTFFDCLEVQAEPVENKLQSLIETKADLGFMAILGGDMKYNLSGQKIYRYQDFKSLIYPLHDPEASRLIQEAESTDFISWIVLSAGVATSIDIALIYKPNIFFNSDFPDRLITGLETVQIGFGAFAILHNIAEGRKFNAVQRYNHLLRKQSQESSLQLNPELYTCSSGLVLGGQLTF
jgi:hypothetical protein